MVGWLVRNIRSFSGNVRFEYSEYSTWCVVDWLVRNIRSFSGNMPAYVFSEMFLRAFFVMNILNILVTPTASRRVLARRALFRTAPQLVWRQFEQSDQKTRIEVFAREASDVAKRSSLACY